MIKTIVKQTKKLWFKSTLLMTSFIVTSSLALAEDTTDPLSKGLPTIKAAFAVGSTFYYTLFAVGLAGALIKGKTTGDWGKWLGGWAVCLVAYTVGGLIIAPTA